MADTQVVISGIGGYFPQSNNVQDFGRDLLANKYLPQATDRWKHDDFLDVAPTCGQVPFEHFDDVFYGVSRRLAKYTDPASKLGYLRSFEAITDAGLNPQSLRGSMTAVFTGAALSEFEQKNIFSAAFAGYAVMGLSKTMCPNRISYYFDFKGPSCAVDANWVGGHLVVQHAAEAIRSGACESAIAVCGAIARFPNTSYLLKSLGIVTGSDVTRSFDQDGTGTVRGDCAVAFFLQRGDRAKRCYAEVVAAGLEFVGPRTAVDVTLPSASGMTDFLERFYRVHGIDPRRIAYLEADGTGCPLRDETEVNAIYSALVQGSGRQGPLLLGSVKSNIGTVDCVNGLVAMCKAVIAMETGIIPATINYKTPNAGVPSLVSGKIKVVDTNTPLKLTADTLLAVNTLAVTSYIGHTVLKPNPRPPAPPQDASQHLPRLITLSSRTEEGLRDIIAKVQAEPFDPNFYRLVQDAFSADIRGYDWRSYIICPPGPKDVAPIARLEKRTLWFVYSGMGSQWAGMGAGLMQLPIFAETIERLHAVLAEKGMDLKTIITETGPQAFDNILKSFVGITACQIALTNVLEAVGLVPDGIIGHSVGELGCAYADRCLTEEQTILAAWARGVASNKASLIKGMMAAIGLGYKDVMPRLPKTIDVACHNSDTSCTLSGPTEDVQKFVQQLTKEGIFARAVNVSDIAYHSRYIQPAAPFLRSYLKEVIPTPKVRSAKWITTSVPENLRDSDLCKYCSAEYQTNNLLSAVLFEEALAFLPAQSLVLEVAPHGLLQAILKRALPDPIHVPLTQRGHPDPVNFLFNAIGKTALVAAAPKVAALYPDVQFPVPRGTPSVAQLVTWLRDDTTLNDMFEELKDKTLASAVSIDIDSPFMNLKGTRVFTLSEMLNLMWESVSKQLQQSISSFPVTFTDVLIAKWKTIPAQGEDEMQAQRLLGTPLVELTNAQAELIASASAFVTDKDAPPPTPLPAVVRGGVSEAVTVLGDELYRDLAARGLAYTSRHQNIKAIEMLPNDWVVTVAHDGNLANFVESVVQVFLIQDTEGSHDLCLPSRIQRLDINPLALKGKTEVVLRLHLPSRVLAGESVYAAGVAFAPAPSALGHNAAPSVLQFVPFGETKFQSLEDFLRLAAHTVLDSGSATTDVTLMELPNGRKTSDLCKALVSAVSAAAGVEARLVTLTPEGTQPPGFTGRVPLLVTGLATLTEAACALAVGVAGALLVWSPERLASEGAQGSGLAVLAEQRVGGDWLTLLRRAQPLAAADAEVIELRAGAPPPRSVPGKKGAVVVVWRGAGEDAVQPAVAAVDALPYAAQARLVFILDDAAPRFSLSEPKYAEQLARGARVNVLTRGGVWGSWRALPVSKPPSAAFSASSLGGVRLEYLGINPLDLSLPLPPVKAKGRGKARGSLSGNVDFVGVPEGDADASQGRVMGVGQWLSDHCRPRLDPLLRWPVPKAWSSKDAATVPCVYAMVYNALVVKAEARRGESILVHEGSSAIGQAAIRIATHLGCSPVYTTVRDAKQRQLLQTVFPKLDQRHVLACGEGEFEIGVRQLTKGRGVRLVVNTLPDAELQASIRCLGHWGRLMHFKREDMLAARKIGSQFFLLSCAVYGFSGHELFRGCDRDRREVAQAVARGLRDGVVQPIVGAKVFDVHQGANDLADCNKAVIQVKASPSAGQQCDAHRSYLVVGNQVSDVLLLAERLSLFGARHIVAALGASTSTSALVRHRQRALRRQNGTHLRVQHVAAWDAAAAAGLVKAAASEAPLHTAIVVAKDDADLDVPPLLDAALAADTALVVLAERAGAACRLASLAGQRNARGRTTACLVAPLIKAAEHIVDLLNGQPSWQTPSTVTVWPTSASATTTGADCLASALPSSPSALAALGRRALELDAVAAPRIKELSSLGQSGVKEVQPVFTLPPLGVLDAAAGEQLSALSARLFSPIMVVETSVDSVARTAQAVVKAMLALQPHGPYNVLGWRLSTVLALEVQRQLEAAGKRGVLFLLHGDVAAVRQWAAAVPPAQRVRQALVGELRDDGNPETRRGLQALTALVDALAKHEPRTAIQSNVHVIRGSVDDLVTFDVNAANVTVVTFEDRRLDSDSMGQFLNKNLAWSRLAGDDDLRLAIHTAGSTL